MKNGLLTLTIFCCAMGLSVTSKAQSYSDKTSAAGINHIYGQGNMGGGVSFADYNRDGWDDLTFCTSSGQKIQVYKNNGKDSFIIDTLMTPPDTSQHKQALWLDYDKDGDNDLFLTSFTAESRLYRNDGDTALVDVTTAAGVATFALDANPVYGACWGDYNNDGYPDLFVTKYANNDKNYLFKNNKDGTFTDVAQTAGVDDKVGTLAFCAAFIDYNNDGYQDIYVIYDRYGNANALFKNNANGTFTNVSAAAKADISINAMSVGVGDYDNNGYLDIYITNTNEGNKLLKNNGDGTFNQVADSTGCEMQSTSWAANFLDYDNDRDEDIYVSGMVDKSTVLSSQLYKNDGDSTFLIPTNDGLDYDTVISFSNAIGDYNNDGYPDIAVSNYTPYSSQVWKNSGGTNKWVKFKLEGVSDTKEGLGTWIDVYAGGKKYSQYVICGEGFLTQNSFNQLMGLKSYNVMDSIHVRWLNGTTDKYYNVKANKKYTIKQGVTKHPVPDWINKTTMHLCPGDSIVIDAGNFASYFWSDSTTDSIIVIKKAGVYNVTVTNEYNFEGKSPDLTVIMYDSIKANITTKDALCNNLVHGEIKVDITNGIPPFGFSWSGGLLGDTLNTQVLQGTYTLTIIDAQQCFTYRDTVEIKGPDTLDVDKVIIFNPCFGDSKGAIYLNAKGGVTPYTYDWGIHGMGSSLENLQAAPYRVVIKDSNECTLIDTIEVEQPSILMVDFAPKDISCFGKTDGELKAIGVGGAGGYSYAWKTGPLSDKITSLAEGWYIVTVKDQNDCEVTDSGFVSEPDVLQVALSKQDLLCFGDNSGSITATPSGGTGDYSYIWTPSLKDSNYVSGLGAGAYSLEVKDANNCSATDNITVTQPDKIMLTTNSTPDTAGKQVGKAWVVATGGTGTLDYLWSDNQNTDTASGLLTGMYSVTVTDDNGCEQTEMVFVDIISSTIHLSFIQSVNAYPNPASNLVNIDINSLRNISATLKVVDINGREVISENKNIGVGDNTLTLDVSKLATGTYFISIMDGANKLADIKILVNR